MQSTASKKLQAVVNMATEETKGHTVPLKKKSIYLQHTASLSALVYSQLMAARRSLTTGFSG
jgi:hypothetical protein